MILDLTASTGSAFDRDSIDVAGETISFTSRGRGSDVVLLHGALVTLDDMLLGLGELADEFRIVAFDRPGHGHSSRRSRNASLWHQAEILHEAFQQLSLSRPVVVGHSYGGAVALAYGMMYPDEVSGIVALAPICFPEFRLEHVLFGPRATPVMGKRWAALADDTVDHVLMPALWRLMFKPQAMPVRYEHDFPFDLATRSTGTPNEGEEAMCLWPDLARSAIGYSSMTARVTIMGGTRDIVVNNALHGAMASRLIPGAVYEPVPGAGHMLHHFHQERVADQIRAFAPPAAVSVVDR